MTLIWKVDEGPEKVTNISPKNAHGYEHASSQFGAFSLHATCNLRHFKDGTREYMVYLHVPCASSSEWITLVRIRGNLLDAINAAERALFKFCNEDRMYRLPLGCVDAKPAVKKLLDHQPKCFECDSETCAFNPEGVCMYPVVYGKAPNLETFDGCSGWVEKREE